MRAGGLIRHLAVAAGIGGLVTAAGLAPAFGSAAGASASAPGWRIVKTIGQLKGDTDLSDVSASGASNAWTTGVLCNDACVRAGENDVQALIEHWTGHQWDAVAPPAGFTFLGHPTAIPGGKAWFLADLPSGKERALLWTGRAWRNTGALPCGTFSFTAFSASSVWAFGHEACAARFNGHSWRRVSLPAGLVSVSAVSASDIWAVGVSRKTLNGKPANFVHLAMRWNGHSWRTWRLPKIKVGSGMTLGFGPVIALGARNVYAAYGEGGNGGCCRALGILHWNGTAWRHLKIPYAMSTLSGLTRDGHGGIWLLVGATSKDSAHYQRLYHDSHGHWTRRYVPLRAGIVPDTLQIAWIPGTRSVWGVSSIEPTDNPFAYRRAAIYKYGR
jgi:hypothetical protein